MTNGWRIGAQPATMAADANKHDVKVIAQAEKYHSLRKVQSRRPRCPDQGGMLDHHGGIKFPVPRQRVEGPWVVKQAAEPRAEGLEGEPFVASGNSWTIRL